MAYCAAVSMMLGIFLFHAAKVAIELRSIGPSAPAILLTNVAANGATAFLIIMAMTFRLVLSRRDRAHPSHAHMNPARTF